MTSSTPKRRTAVALAENELYLLPTHWIRRNGACSCGRDCPKPGKHPFGRAVPHGRLDASADVDVVLAWWTRWPWCNIGLALEQSGLWALDEDRHEGGEDGVQAVADLEVMYGGLPITPTARTGGGGRHRIFTASPDLDYHNLGPGVDVKHEGYILVAPSNHVSGRTYQWEPGRSIVDVDPADAPEWLELMVTGPKRPRSERRASGGPALFEMKIGSLVVRAGTDRTTCPMCGSPDGFYALSGGRWCCQSTRHDAVGVGRRGRGCWTGDGMDLVMFYAEVA